MAWVETRWSTQRGGCARTIYGTTITYRAPAQTISSGGAYLLCPQQILGSPKCFSLVLCKTKIGANQNQNVNRQTNEIAPTISRSVAGVVAVSMSMLQVHQRCNARGRQGVYLRVKLADVSLVVSKNKLLVVTGQRMQHHKKIRAQRVKRLTLCPSV